MAEPPQRLIYGLLPWTGEEGVVMDAEVAARFAAGATARTFAEFQTLFYRRTWDEYLAELDEDDDPPSPHEAFDFGEWLSEEVATSPQEAAWDVAHWRVAEILADGSEIVKQIESGGGSPGGNMDQISGPIEALDYIASNVDPARDGFSLERDDEAVQAAWPRSLYESD